MTSLENTQPLLTFANYGGDIFFVHELYGYVAIVYELAFTFLQHKDGKTTYPHLKLNKVCFVVKRRHYTSLDGENTFGLQVSNASNCNRETKG